MLTWLQHGLMFMTFMQKSKSVAKRQREDAEESKADKAAKKMRLEMRQRGHAVRKLFVHLHKRNRVYLSRAIPVSACWSSTSLQPRHFHVLVSDHTLSCLAACNADECSLAAHVSFAWDGHNQAQPLQVNCRWRPLLYHLPSHIWLHPKHCRSSM